MVWHRVCFLSTAEEHIYQWVTCVTSLIDQDLAYARLTSKYGRFRNDLWVVKVCQLHVIRKFIGMTLGRRYHQSWRDHLDKLARIPESSICILIGTCVGGPCYRPTGSSPVQLLDDTSRFSYHARGHWSAILYLYFFTHKSLGRRS